MNKVSQLGSCSLLFGVDLHPSLTGCCCYDTDAQLKSGVAYKTCWQRKSTGTVWSVVVWSNWGFLRLLGLTTEGPPTPTGPLSASSTRPNTATSNWVLQHFILCSHHKKPSTWVMTWRPLASNKAFQTGFPCEAETDPHWGAVFSHSVSTFARQKCYLKLPAGVV